MPDANIVPSEPGPLRGALVGAITGVVTGFLGFFLAIPTHGGHMGEVMFILVPLLAGAAIALVTPRPIAGATILASVIPLIICLISLVTLKLEGMLCAILAFPLILLALLIGVGLGTLIRIATHYKQNLTSTSIMLVMFPLLIVGGRSLETMTLKQVRESSITTRIHLKALPEEVWANIQALDRVAGRKPMLMYLGLPVPQRCVLLGTSVGSKRICYFDQGYIEETVLEWDPPHRMRLSIDRTNLPGRHWLEFNGAEYTLQGEANGTLLTRTTTIRSNLSPGWYWGPLERWGVSSEHKFLFSDLTRRFSIVHE